MPNGIDLIVADHELVNTLFTEFESTGQGALVGQIVDALVTHDDAEHAALYPLAADVLGDTELLARSSAAHSAVKRQIDLIKQLEGPPLAAAVAELRTLVTEHVADEEQNLLPALRAAATPDQLDALGGRLLQSKQRVG